MDYEWMKEAIIDASGEDSPEMEMFAEDLLNGMI